MTDLSADSAGVPWAGRHFEPNPAAADDGSAPPALIDVLERFRRGDASVAAVVDTLRDSRLLVPLVAEVGGDARSDRHAAEYERAEHERAELSIVTVAGPDGRDVLPVFSSAAAMLRWNPSARPVPADAVRVALAAADDHTDLAVLDPTSPTEFAIRRPALWAIARQRSWVPSYDDPSVRAAFDVSIRPEPDVVAVSLAAGDPTARLAAPELVVTMTVRAGLDGAAIRSVLDRLQHGWAASAVIAERVDSLAIEIVSQA